MPWAEGRLHPVAVAVAVAVAVTAEGREHSESAARERIARLLAEMEPWDEEEHTHLGQARQWVAGGAPLYRLRPPDDPSMHLVSYFAVLDEARREMLLVGHRKAGLWLPPGGHGELPEDPWETVARECPEELHIDAVPSSVTGRDPLLLTVTPTRGPHPHVDVSFWHVVQAPVEAVTTFDMGEFTGVRWSSLERILAEPIDGLDPHLHRFTRKLLAALSG